MKRFSTVMLYTWMGLVLTLAGCTKQEADNAAGAVDNAGDSMAQKSENAAENTGEAMENAGDAAGNAAEGAGSAMGNAAEGAGAAAGNAAGTVSNAGVTAKIKNAIVLSPAIKNLASRINVNTTDSQVILKGQVTTNGDSQEAERLARMNAGGRTVVNQLTVSK